MKERSISLFSLSLLAFATAFAGCGDPELDDGVDPANSSAELVAPPTWGPCPPSEIDGAGTGKECATVVVPIDYREPRGRSLRVAISRMKARNPALRRGVLLLNPGGPGGRGLDLPDLFGVALPESVLDRYDLIGFDPRFVGRSAPLSCGLTQGQATDLALTAEQPGGFRATVPVMRAVADSCARAAGDRLPFATTSNTARDLDRVRQALGEEKISYLGYSYGTYLGAVYATMFPAHSDRIILDSSVDPKSVWRDQFRAFGLGGALRFPDFAAFAADGDALYHLGATPADVTKLFSRLIARLDRRPVPLLDGLALTGARFRSATFQLLYSDESFPLLGGFWGMVDALPSNPALEPAIQEIFQTFDDTPPADVPIDNSIASGFAVLCADVAWPRAVDRYERERDADVRRFPLFGAVGSTILPCAFWPSVRREPPAPVTGDGPPNILILENLRDPATPRPGALGMRDALRRRARLVTVDQGGHGVYIVTPNACAGDIATAFLIDGALPATDPFCPAESPAVPRAQTAAVSTTRDRAIHELRRRCAGVRTSRSR